MDPDLWAASQLGRAVTSSGGPSLRRRRRSVRAQLGARLRAWRRHSGLTDRDAHRRLGLSGAPSRLHPLETGEAPWTPAEVEALADAVGTRADDLVRAALQAADHDHDSDRAAFVAWAARLTGPEWDRLVDEVDRARDADHSR